MQPDVAVHGIREIGGQVAWGSRAEQALFVRVWQAGQLLQRDQRPLESFERFRIEAVRRQNLIQQ